MAGLRFTPKLGVVLALILVSVVVIATRPDKRPPLEAMVPPQVETTPVEVRDLAPSERLTGRLQPARRADLRFEVAGRLEARLVEPGQRVDAGAELLRLNAADYRDALREAEAQLALERASIARDRRLLKLAEENRATQARDVERQEQLGQRSLVSESRLDESRQRLLQLQAEEAQLRHSVDTAQARIALRESARDKAARALERSVLTAPFAGTVNSISVDVGDFVNAGGMALALIDATELDLYLQVRGSVAAGLERGQSVPVRVAGIELTGTLVARQTDPDPTTFTHAVRVRIQGDRAHAGDPAEVELPLQPLTAALTVPSTAILRQEGRSYLFQVDGTTLHRIEVTPGPRVGLLQVIEDGVEADALIVARDVAALSDGQTISLNDVSATEQGAATQH